MAKQDSVGKVLSLPEELSADQVEHLGAAVLATGGLFVEKNITEKAANREVHEMDAFGTAWKERRPYRVLVEAKSGGWGTRDLFALLGRKVYLDAGLAILLHSTQENPEEKDLLLARFEKRGHAVKSCSVDDISSPQLIAKLCEVDNRTVSERMNMIHSLQAWRYAFWTERALLHHLTREAKSLGDRVSNLLTARKLLERLNECFFLFDCRDQARHLYDFYSKHPKLTVQMIEERRKMAPGDELRRLSAEEAFKACVYDGRVPGVQACMYLEHRARCLLLKAAVDMAMIARVPTTGFNLKDKLVPPSFTSFAAQVAKIPDPERLPQLWQAYILGWGGFIVTARAEEEYEYIGLEAGLKPEQVHVGLKAFDKLFPVDGRAWHYEQDDNTGIILLKMVPNVFRGLGVQRRRWIYGDKEFFRGLPSLGREDCVKWATCGYELLSADIQQARA